jgi:hypothetical protein
VTSPNVVPSSPTVISNPTIPSPSTPTQQSVSSVPSPTPIVPITVPTTPVPEPTPISPPTTSSVTTITPIPGPSNNGSEIDSNYYFYVDGPEEAYYFVDAPDVVYQYYFIGSTRDENMECVDDIVPDVKKCKVKIPKKTNETCTIPTPTPTPPITCIGPHCGPPVVCVGDNCPLSTPTPTPTINTVKDCVYYGTCDCYYW